LMVARCSPKPL